MNLLRKKKLPIHKGLLITTVRDGSICDYAGLVPDDIIMEVDGKPSITLKNSQPLGSIQSGSDA